MLAILALLAAASDSDSFRLHGGLSVGLGTTYDGLGVHAEIGTAHFGLFAGTGLMGRLVSGPYSVDNGRSVSFGARWYKDVRSGWFVSANGTYSWTRWYFDENNTSGATYLRDTLTAGAVGGHRWQTSPLFFEIGAGVLWFRDRPPGEHGVAPDIALGVGFDL